MVPRPHVPRGVRGPDDVCVLLARLGPDAGRRLGVLQCLLVGEVVDDLTGGRVDHLDAAVQEAHTYIRPVLSVPQAEDLSPALDGIKDPDVAVGHGAAIVPAAEE